MQVLDQGLALVLEAEGLGVHLDHLVDRRAPGDLGVGDDRRDLGEGVVLLLRQAGVCGEDDVGLGVGDGLVVDAVGLVEQHRGVGAELVELVLDPGQHAVVVVVAPGRLAHADRHDAEGQRHLVVRPRDRRDALGLLGDRGLAVDVLDRDGEGVIGCGVAAGVVGVVAGRRRRAGGEAEGERRGDAERREVERCAQAFPSERVGVRRGGAPGFGKPGLI